MYFELKFLSNDDSVHVKDTDINTFKYESKKPSNCMVYATGKRTYCECRGQKWKISSKKPTKLKEHLFDLNDHFKEYSVILCEWNNENVINIIFSSGAMVHLVINANNTEVERIVIDKFCVGKLSPNPISAIFTETHLLFLYPENVATLFTFNPPKTSLGIDKLSGREPKYQSIELYGPARKSEKHAVWRAPGAPACAQGAAPGPAAPAAEVLVWSPAPAPHLYPWAPSVAPHDRANLHLYNIHKGEVTLGSYHTTEHEVLSVELSRLQPALVYILQQTTNPKGGMSVWHERFEAGGGALRACVRCAWAVSAPVRTAARSPCERRVLLACIDAALLLYRADCPSAPPLHFKAAFIPLVCVWTGAGATLAEERGRVQCVDAALQPLAPHHASALDTAHHLQQQGSVARVVARGGVARGVAGGEGAGRDALLLLYEGGPLALLTVTHHALVQRYLREGQVQKAINLLRALDWDAEGDACLYITHAICKHLFRWRLNAAREAQVQATLGCWHAPARPPSPRARALYAAPLHDLTRKFFHHLLRWGRVDKALSLAMDVRDWDTYVDAQHGARARGLHALEREARAHALHAVAQLTHSTCSASSCSLCSSRTSSDCGSLSDDSSDVPKTSARPPPPRAPPPLPRLPAPQPPLPLSLPPSVPSLQPPLPQSVPPLQPPLSVPVIPLEPAPAHSIRPVHQYLDRDTTLWTEVTTDSNTSRNVSNQPQSMNGIISRNDFDPHLSRNDFNLPQSRNEFNSHQSRHGPSIHQSRNDFSQSHSRSEFNQPQSRNEFNQSHSRNEFNQSHSRNEFNQSYSRNEFNQPQSRNEFNKPQIRNEFNQSHSRNEFNQPQSRNEFNQSQSRNEFNQSHSRNEFNQPHSKNEYSQPQSSNEFNQPQSRNEFNQSHSRNEFNQPHSKNEFNQPQSRNEFNSLQSINELNPSQNRNDRDNERGGYNHSRSGYKQLHSTYQSQSGHKSNNVIFDFDEVSYQQNDDGFNRHHFDLIKNTNPNSHSHQSHPNQKSRNHHTNQFNSIEPIRINQRMYSPIDNEPTHNSNKVANESHTSVDGKITIKPPVPDIHTTVNYLRQENHINRIVVPHRQDFQPTHKVIDIIPRMNENNFFSMRSEGIYQTELAEERRPLKLNLDPDKVRYRSVYGQKSALVNKGSVGSGPDKGKSGPDKGKSGPDKGKSGPDKGKSGPDKGKSTVNKGSPGSGPEKGKSTLVNKGLPGSGPDKGKSGPDGEPRVQRPAVEKNVKFSDTISVAVVPEVARRDRGATGNIVLGGAGSLGGGPDPARELRDSLPLQAPHRDYLADFERRADTPSDYVEV